MARTSQVKLKDVKIYDLSCMFPVCNTSSDSYLTLFNLVLFLFRYVLIPTYPILPDTSLFLISFSGLSPFIPFKNYIPIFIPSLKTLNRLIRKRKRVFSVINYCQKIFSYLLFNLPDTFC